MANLNFWEVSSIGSFRSHWSRTRMQSANAIQQKNIRYEPDNINIQRTAIHKHSYKPLSLESIYLCIHIK